MKIIDFKKKGNVIRFYLGKDDLDYWYGDDWDDLPYEHNAGTVYEEFISGIIDVAFPFSYAVIEPKDDWHYQGNSPFHKHDMRMRNVPCIISVPPTGKYSYIDEDNFSIYVASDNVDKFYFGDDMNAIAAKELTVIQLKKLEYNKEERTLYDEDGKEFSIY